MCRWMWPAHCFSERTTTLEQVRENVVLHYSSLLGWLVLYACSMMRRQALTHSCSRTHTGTQTLPHGYMLMRVYARIGVPRGQLSGFSIIDSHPGRHLRSTICRLFARCLNIVCYVLVCLCVCGCRRGRGGG